MKQPVSPFILCDHIVENTDLTYLVEMLCEVFYESKLFTLSHKGKNFEGVLNQREIVSTHISSTCHNSHQVYQYQFQLPFLLKNLLREDFSHGIVITNGHLLPLSRLLNKPLLFLLMPNYPFEEKPSGWKRKIWKGLERPRDRHRYITFYKHDKEFWEKRGIRAQYLPFPMRLENILFKKELGSVKEEFVWLEGTYENGPDWLKKISQKIKSQGKSQSSERIQFIPQDCSGDLSELRNEALFHIDLEQKFFPKGLIQALGSGRPACIHEKYRSLISSSWRGVKYYDDSFEDWDQRENLSREELRQQTFSHHSLRLKKKVYEWSLEQEKN